MELVNSLSQELTLQEVLSGIFGSVSLATWIFLLVPQLILNYRTKSAEGISLAFLFVWLLGDITNMSGALWAGLVPTVIALAVYFCFADVVLIGQCLYYNNVNAQKLQNLESAEARMPTEEDALLTRRRSNSSIGLPGSHRRRSSTMSSVMDHHNDSLSKITDEDDSPTGNAWLKNTLSILAVFAVGTAGWVIAWQSGVWTPTPENGPNNPKTNDVAVGAEVLGYFSAVCYLGARIPQIIKNYKDKSCEGLALLFFLLSLMGNLTYGASILFHSLEKEYLIINTPWLVGSLGTMVEDAIIFVQFRMYAPKPASTLAVDDE
ncbi:hypothetical protein ACMFMG_001207 [Clarireedia jacksonii]